jgi:starvation-inducible DNA-binding protein
VQNNFAEVALLINSLLGDEYLLYARTRRAQWDIEGSNFTPSRKFFEIQFEILDKIIYSTNEKVRLLGSANSGSLDDFLKAVRLNKKEDNDPDDKTIIIKRLFEHHESLIRLLRQDIITVGGTYKDFDTVVFLSGLLEKHERIAWMLTSHLE